MVNEKKIELALLTEEEAVELSRNILKRTIKTLGFAPNLYRMMAHNPALLDAYTHSYDTFRKNGGLSPIEQEVVFLSIAAENKCPYCMAAHSFVADKMSKVPIQITEAIRNGTEIEEQKLGALSRFAAEMVKARGWASKDQINQFISSGYDKNAVLAIIAAIGVKTMSNYLNHITNTPLDEIFKERKWEIT